MRKPAALLALAVTAVAGLSGCSAAPPHPTPSAYHQPAPVIFSGIESGQQDILAPAGSHSAAITVVCGGDSDFTLSGALNPTVSGLNGHCDGGTHRYRVEVAALRKLRLEIELSASGRYVVEVQFSAERTKPDVEVSAQCKAMVTVGSDVFNAEDGYSRGALSLAQWKDKLSGAVAAVKSLSPEKPNILSPSMAAILESLTRTGLAPGGFSGPTSVAYRSAASVVNQVCEDNGTAIYVNAEYGG